ncbi:MAG: 4Fe-4S dicluster domain-containing protein [Candidatus Omnitrophica bacterium]|nr:4Fe-4S dicluster domain-containing protein [Candidatus Omnitrophota bacterium]
MEKYVVLKKKDFNDFIAKLALMQTVVAPVKKGKKSFAFQEVTTGKEIALQYIPTILPPKKYFMPQQETIMKFNKAKFEWTPVLEYNEITIFGVHTCDLAGIQCLNMVFTNKPKDINYIVRKDKITIIGFECNAYCDEFASCAAMDNHIPNGGYDLFFTELNDSFIIHVNTLMGEKIIEEISLFSKANDDNLKELEELRTKKREIFKNELNTKHSDLKAVFENSFNSKVWKDIGAKCVACGNCTNVCPTCYCFDIKDEMNLDFNTGSRIRVWDSCQNEDFAKVAGGESFREERANRQKHRYMRKFNYPVDKFSRYFCTGCGRCTRTCMAQIKLKETVNALAEEKK